MLLGPATSTREVSNLGRFGSRAFQFGSLRLRPLIDLFLRYFPSKIKQTVTFRQVFGVHAMIRSIGWSNIRQIYAFGLYAFEY